MTDFLTPLPVADLRDLGIPEPWSFGIADRVRFYELDALGHVNNGAYLKWCETMRVYWIRERMFPDYAPGEPSFVLREVGCTFNAPLFLGDTYVVTGRCESVRTSSFRKVYGIWSGKKLVAEAFAVCVFTNREGTRKVPLPDALRRSLIDRDGARDEA